MATKKEQQTPKSDTIPTQLIRMDADKIRAMSIDRKDVIDMLASDYEDKCTERVVTLTKDLNDLVTAFNEQRVTASNITGEEITGKKAVGKLDKIFIDSIYKEVKKRFKDTKDENIEHLSVKCVNKEFEEFFVNPVSVDAITDRLDEFLLPQNTDEHVNSSVRYIRSALYTNPADIINKIDMYVVDSSFTENNANIVAKAAKTGFVSLSYKREFYISQTKEITARLIEKRRLAQKIITIVTELSAAKHDLEALPSVVRRLKSRLTKRVMGESETGRRIIEYFEAELDASKSVQALIPRTQKKRR